MGCTFIWSINFMKIYISRDRYELDRLRGFSSPEKTANSRYYLPTNFPRKMHVLSQSTVFLLRCLWSFFFFFKHSSRMASTTLVAESSFWKRHAQLERSLFLNEQRSMIWDRDRDIDLRAAAYYVSRRPKRQGTLMPLCSPSLYIWHLESAEHACANLTR